MGTMVMNNRLGLSEYTLSHFFEKVIDNYGANPALAIAGEEPLTYAEFGQMVEDVRETLKQLGLKRQDKVVILGQGSPNWTVAFMAVTTLGAVAVPVMDEFPEVDIEHIIYHSDAAAIFITESLHQSLNLPSLEQIKIILSLDSLLLLSEEPQAPSRWKIPGRIMQSRTQPDQETDQIREDDLAEILYTSGTTGHSKGVMLTHKSLVTNLIVGPEILGFIDEDSVLLGILPLAHAFGLITTLSASSLARLRLSSTGCSGSPPDATVPTRASTSPSTMIVRFIEASPETLTVRGRPVTRFPSP